jgi:hypothetical protein
LIYLQMLALLLLLLLVALKLHLLLLLVLLLAGGCHLPVLQCRLPVAKTALWLLLLPIPLVLR